MTQSLMTVSSLNTQIKSLLEATFIHVQIEGEVASLTYHTSGHLYFSIQDAESTLRCVMWRSAVSKMRFQIKAGMHIIIHGSIRVYAPRGEYQLQAISIEPYGQGALALAYEQLKGSLQAKGYFDPKHKKSLPRFPRHLAMVTATGGAALQDMLTVARKRWPLTTITVVDVLVQGEEAATQIAHGITYADTLEADIIVVGRGGGSLEDLWAFNEAVVAEAIHAAYTPIVSAVGHEVDTLISDLVADLRAPTPSAAMEMILPDRYEIMRRLDEIQQQVLHRIQTQLQHHEALICSLQEHLGHRSPFNRLEQGLQLLAQRREAFDRTLAHRIEQHAALILPYTKQYNEAMHFGLSRKLSQLKVLAQRFDLLDPAKQMRKGFAEILHNGKRTHLQTIRTGDHVILSDGTCALKVEALDECPEHLDFKPKQLKT